MEKIEEKKKLLIFDNCLMGDCNMSCLYCRDKKSSNSSQRFGKTLLELKKISLLAADTFDIPILKVSGYGEIFLLPNILEALKAFSRSYERIQLITNATLLDKKTILKLSKIKGINVCVSLDGHTPELNFCRTKSKNAIKKILDNISILRDCKVPVEINSVLTRHNIPGFVDFAGYLADRYDQLVCYPYPVRSVNSLAVSGHKDAGKLSELLDSYNRFSHIFPPKEYLKRMISFIREGKRKNKCFVGFANLGIDPSGDILVCACSLKQSVSNIFAENAKSALHKRKTSPLFYKFLFKDFSFDSCKHCLTHYEVINLYFDGSIPLKEISRIPLFAGERTQKVLKGLMKELTC